MVSAAKRWREPSTNDNSRPGDAGPLVRIGRAAAIETAKPAEAKVRPREGGGQAVDEIRSATWRAFTGAAADVANTCKLGESAEQSPACGVALRPCSE